MKLSPFLRRPFEPNPNIEYFVDFLKPQAKLMLLWPRTWVWDGQVWTQNLPATSPRRECLPLSHTMQAGSTWIWDGSNWTQQSPVHRPPAALVDSNDVPDGRHANTVVRRRHGTDVSSRDGGLERNGLDSTVNYANAACPNPAANAYDAGHEQVVLFGRQTGPANSDTWIWNGILPAGGNPQSGATGNKFFWSLNVTRGGAEWCIPPETQR